MTITKIKAMKKYKLIKKYPFCEYELGIMVPTMLTVNEYKNYPEFWQEVKEPLFVTEDGIKYYNSEDYVYGVWFVGEGLNPVLQRIKIEVTIIDNIRCFSTKEAAEQWIKENKPRFSEKQVLDASNKIKLITTQAGMFAIDKSDFLKELGL